MMEHSDSMDTATKRRYNQIEKALKRNRKNCRLDNEEIALINPFASDKAKGKKHDHNDLKLKHEQPDEDVSKSKLNESSIGNESHLKEKEENSYIERQSNLIKIEEQGYDQYQTPQQQQILSHQPKTQYLEVQQRSPQNQFSKRSIQADEISQLSASQIQVPEQQYGLFTRTEVSLPQSPNMFAQTPQQNLAETGRFLRLNNLEKTDLFTPTLNMAQIQQSMSPTLNMGQIQQSIRMPASQQNSNIATNTVDNNPPINIISPNHKTQSSLIMGQIQQSIRIPAANPNSYIATNTADNYTNQKIQQSYDSQVVKNSGTNYSNIPTSTYQSPQLIQSSRRLSLGNYVQDHEIEEQLKRILGPKRASDLYSSSYVSPNLGLLESSKLLGSSLRINPITSGYTVWSPR